MKTIEDYYISNPEKLKSLIKKLPQEERERFDSVFDSMVNNVNLDYERYLILDLIAQIRIESNKIPYNRFEIMDFDDDD
jgi:hypothetical protein